MEDDSKDEKLLSFNEMTLDDRILKVSRYFCFIKNHLNRRRRFLQVDRRPRLEKADVNSGTSYSISLGWQRYFSKSMYGIG